MTLHSFYFDKLIAFPVFVDAVVMTYHTYCTSLQYMATWRFG